MYSTMRKRNRPEEWSTNRKVTWDLIYLGHFLNFNFGGRGGQTQIVLRLAKHDGHMTQRELQESFDISSASLSEVLAKVEASGYITRAKSETDRRQMEVTLTPSGFEHAKTVRARREEFDQIAFGALSEDERKQLLVLLDRLVDSWGEQITDEEG